MQIAFNKHEYLCKNLNFDNEVIVIRIHFITISAYAKLIYLMA